MKQARKTDGLKRSAVQRRNSARERAEEALTQMIKEKARINVSRVAKRAQVSRTWIYGEADLVERIEHLRVQENTHFDLPPKKERPSSASNEAKIAALMKRVHTLTAENKELRQQLEVLGGLVYSATLAERK